MWLLFPCVNAATVLVLYSRWFMWIPPLHSGGERMKLFLLRNSKCTENIGTSQREKIPTSHEGLCQHKLKWQTTIVEVVYKKPVDWLLMVCEASCQLQWGISVILLLGKFVFLIVFQKILDIYVILKRCRKMMHTPEGGIIQAKDKIVQIKLLVFQLSACWPASSCSSCLQCHPSICFLACFCYDCIISIETHGEQRFFCTLPHNTEERPNNPLVIPPVHGPWMQLNPFQKWTKTFSYSWRRKYF